MTNGLAAKGLPDWSSTFDNVSNAVKVKFFRALLEGSADRVDQQGKPLPGLEEQLLEAEIGWHSVKFQCELRKETVANLAAGELKEIAEKELAAMLYGCTLAEEKFNTILDTVNKLHSELKKVS